MITDGIRINNKHSYTDFDLYIAERNIGIPAKKVIKESVPFANGEFDFSALGGNVAWNDRTISYTFDIVGVTVEAMEIIKGNVIAWLMNVQNDEIYDDAYPDTHFYGSYNDCSWDEDDEQGHLTVNFSCYPFRIANAESLAWFSAYSQTQSIYNDGVPVQATITAPMNVRAIVMNGGASFSMSAGKTTLPSPMISGANTVAVGLDNLLATLPESSTNNGITFTVTPQTVTANGTATGVAWFYIRSASDVFLPGVGEYRCFGSPANGSGTTHRMQYYVRGTNAGDSYYYDNGGAGVYVPVNSDTQYISVAIRIAQGVTVNNLVFSPRMYPVTKISWKTEVI